MEKLFVLALTAACGAASAQTPAGNPMPDGSRDMYLGLGVESAPRYAGSADRKLSALPVLQVQWSNGVFISGMSAGVHLSGSPSVEFGPLLALQPRRNASGTGPAIGGVGNPSIVPVAKRGAARALGAMDDIGLRLQAGGFFNYYLAQQWRMTSTILYGAGNDRNGAVLDLGVQRLAAELAPHHTLALSAGVSVVNRNYSQAFFGVSPAEAQRSGYAEYHPGGGIKDVRLGARWNWALSPAWLVTSGLQVARLAGHAKESPLAERPTNLTVSTAIAYRF